MNATIPDYLSLLSMDQYDILEDIFEHRFIECIELYWLIKKYSDHITKLQYDVTKRSSSLKVKLKVRGKKVEKLVEELSSVKPKRCITQIKSENREVSIMLRKKPHKEKR